MTAVATTDAYAGLHWDARAVRVAGFTTSGRKGSTSVKVEFVVTSPWELGDFIRHLAELRDQPALPKVPIDG